MKQGLYANIHAKRKRIAEGSGEKMKKPGAKGAPTAEDFEESEKTAKKPKKKDPRLEKAGVDGYNKPKRTPGHPTKSHVVVAKDGDTIKTIRFGQQGVSGSPESEDETEAERKRRESFKARHADNIAKGKLSAAYWADKVKW